MPIQRALVTLPREGMELDSGIFPDAGPEQAPIWVDSENVQFRNGGVESIDGYSLFVSAHANAGASDIPRGMVQQRRSNLTQRVWWGDQSRLYYSIAGGAAQEAGTGYSGVLDETVNAIASVWSMVDWGNFILATNGVDRPQVAESNSFAVWMDSDGSNLPFSTAEILIQRGPHVLAANTSNGHNWVEWCDLDDIYEWTPLAENQAGNLVIREAAGPLMAAAPLGDRDAVYTRNQMFVVNYLGAPNVFGYQSLLEGIGAVSKQAVVAVGRRNFGMSRQGLWWTDGTQFQYFDRGAVRDYLQNSVNWSQATKVAAVHDEEFHRIIWSYPKDSGGEPSESIVYDYKNGTFTLFNFAWTSAVPREVFSFPLGASGDQNIYGLNQGTNANTSAMTKRVKSRPFSFGKGSALTLIDAIVAGFASKDGEVEYRLGVRDRLDDSPTWTDWITLPDGKGPTYPDTSGRWIEIEIRSTELGASWGLDTLTFFGVPIGGSL